MALRAASKWQPYTDGAAPKSAGRVLLSEMMQDYCSEQWLLSPHETLLALRGELDPDTDAAIRSTVGFLSSLLLAGDIPTFVRPFGGGEPARLPPSRWEIDDSTQRFIESAIDPVHWTDVEAVPTHWIFVDAAALEKFLEEWCRPEEDLAFEGHPAMIVAELAEPKVVSGSVPAATPRALIRLPEVKRRSGLSRSQIYKRMSLHTFPLSVALGRRMVAWFEDEVADWVASYDARDGRIGGC